MILVLRILSEPFGETLMGARERILKEMVENLHYIGNTSPRVNHKWVNRISVAKRSHELDGILH